MAKFSKTSKDKLETAHKDLQTLFQYVITNFDCTVVHGHRSPEFQFELYKKGRSLIDGEWIITDKKQWVTNCDGYKIKSKHNESPSLAVDVAPYPTLYSDEDTIRHFAGYVLGVADTLYRLGLMDNKIICGIDWDNDKDLYDQKLFDAVHFQIA